MNNIKVSVIIPIYNASSYLQQTLESVARQTLKEIEIICVNDGSKDDSLEILKRFEDERLIILDQENGGAGKARNAGLAVAKGEYLSFLDADDFFEKDMLEKAYLKAKESQADIVAWRSDQYREDIKQYNSADWTLRVKDIPPYRPAYFRNFTDNVFKIFVGWAWDKLFRREFILEYDLKYQEIRSTNDMLFVFTAIVLAEKVEIIDEVLCHQRRGDPNSISNSREKTWDNYHKALSALKENLIRYHLYDELKQDYINYCLHASLWNLNTISGEKKEVLFHQLKKLWFDEFEISDKNKSYFYIKSEYLQYLLIRTFPYQIWLLVRYILAKLKRI